MSRIQIISLIIAVSIAIPIIGFSESGWKNVSIQIEDSTKYSLNLPWLIQNTLSVRIDSVILIESKDFFWNDSTRSLIIRTEEIWMRQKFILIDYQSAEITDKLTYQLYYFSELDESSKTNFYHKKKINPAHNVNPFGDWGGIHRYGSISRGIQIRGAETTVRSGMHLEMSGRLEKGASIEAMIDDRDISTTNTGGSSTLSELDKIYFRYSTPSLKAELGNIDIDWHSSKYGKFRRQVKGATVSVGQNRHKIDVVAAGNDNTYHRIFIHGRNGDHGPYELTNKNGLPGVQVSPGSERVYLNGKEQTGGYDGAYLIDYRRGTITFTPTVLINSDSRIEIEYEYSYTDYAKFLFAGRATSTTVLSTPLTIQISTIVEGDDNDQPLLYEWTDEMKHGVSAAGDNQSLAFISGVDSVGVGNGDYYYISDGHNRILAFSQPDSLGRPTGYLAVIFSPDQFGNYIRSYDSKLLTYYFEWADSTASGEKWSATRPIPLPKRLVHNDIVISHSNGLFSSYSEIAVSNTDQNTLSKYDDNDNFGVAWQWHGSWGNKISHPFYTSVIINNREENYNSPDRNNDPDYNYQWNLPDSVSASERSVSAKVQLKPIKNFTSIGEAGYLKQGSKFEVNRLGITSNFLWNKWQLNGGLKRILRQSLTSIRESNHVNWNGHISREFLSLGTTYEFNRDDFTDKNEKSAQTGTQRDNHSIALKHNIYSTNELQLRFEYFDEDRKENHQEINWSDTRSITASWLRKRDESKGWSIDFGRSYTTYSEINSPNSTSTNARIDAIKTFTIIPLTIQSDYFLITGNDRINTTVATFVGINQGGYRREGDRYVPDPNGEFDLQDVITDTVSVVSRVDFNSKITFGESAIGYSGNLDQDYWLGFKGSSIRLETELITTDNESWKTFLLHPSSFNSDGAISSRIRILQDYDFVSKDRMYDSRISLNWEQDSDRNSYGGEKNRAESILLSQRIRVNPVVKLELLPAISHSSRRNIANNKKQTDIYTLEGKIGSTIQPPDNPLETGLSFKYTSREDRITLQTAIIREWKPWINYRFLYSGSIRLDGAWIRLSSQSGRSWYDIDRGWRDGNNYKLNISVASQVHDHVSINFYYRGLWINKKSPRHEGLLEFTATL